MVRFTFISSSFFLSVRLIACFLNKRSRVLLDVFILVIISHSSNKSVFCHYYYYYFIIVSGVRLSPLGTAATTEIFYQPQMIDDGDCGAISGMKIWRGNRSTQRKPAPAPLCPPHIPHDQTRARTRAGLVFCHTRYVIIPLLSSFSNTFTRSLDSVLLCNIVVGNMT
jgi:hypothetical protein